jgi:hypothetical protein
MLRPVALAQETVEEPMQEPRSDGVICITWHCCPAEMEFYQALREHLGIAAVVECGVRVHG